MDRHYLANSALQSATAVATAIAIHSINKPLEKQIKGEKLLSLYRGSTGIIINESNNMMYHPKSYKGEWNNIYKSERIKYENQWYLDRNLPIPYRHQ